MSLSLEITQQNDCKFVKQCCCWTLCCPCMLIRNCTKSLKQQREEYEKLEGLNWINGVLDDLTTILEDEREAGG